MYRVGGVESLTNMPLDENQAIFGSFRIAPITHVNIDI